MKHAVVAQRVARLPFQAEDAGSIPSSRLHFSSATVDEVNWLLAAEHYLGPISAGKRVYAGFVDGELVAAQVYRWPTARMLPADGTWLELSRWCLTPECGRNAGSRMMRWVATQLRREEPTVQTLVSYSDPVHGHTGALYKASGWVTSPTHHQRRFDLDGVGYASGHGSWDGVTVQSPKHRWLYELRQAPPPAEEPCSCPYVLMFDRHVEECVIWDYRRGGAL
jgi:hypothetical protein